MSKFSFGLLIGMIVTTAYLYFKDMDRVTYSVCDGNLENCQPPTAWFKTRRDCEYFNKFQDSICDYNSQPGKVTCDFKGHSEADRGACK